MGGDRWARVEVGGDRWARVEVGRDRWRHAGPLSAQSSPAVRRRQWAAMEVLALTLVLVLVLVLSRPGGVGSVQLQDSSQVRTGGRSSVAL